MEITKNEIELAQQLEAAAMNIAAIELTELQLAVVGGGSGNEIFA